MALCKGPCGGWEVGRHLTYMSVTSPESEIKASPFPLSSSLLPAVALVNL